MKKLVALCLLFLLLFNIGGYSVLFWMAEHQATLDLAAKLDNEEFSGSQAITIKVPVSLPYQPDRDYERVDGKFEYNGQHYRLVKQRVLGDTLYVVCVIDKKATQLADDMNNFTKKANDSSNKPLQIVSSNPVQLYSNSIETMLMYSSMGWVFEITFENRVATLNAAFIETNGPPPWS